MVTMVTMPLRLGFERDAVGALSCKVASAS